MTLSIPSNIPGVLLRFYQGEEDMHLQYRFWKDITKDLPFAWKPTQSPIQFRQTEQFHPHSRCFAFHNDKLVGYMSFTGEGEFVSLGYPWVLPKYEGLLQDELFQNVYDFARSEEHGGKVFAQRFRSQWSKQIDYFLSKGFQVQGKQPIYLKDLASQMSHVKIDTAVEVTRDFNFTTFSQIASKNGVTVDELRMLEKYYSSVSFDFAVSDSNKNEVSTYLGITIRRGTSFAEINAVASIDIESFTNCFEGVISLLSKEGINTLAMYKANVPEGFPIENYNMKVGTEDVMMMKT